MLPSRGQHWQKKNYLNLWETCFLATWLEDSFKGKEVLHIV